MNSFKLQIVSQEALLLQLVLNDLDLSDQRDVTRPSWHLLIDLLVLVHDSDLLLEEFFIALSDHLMDISSVVELFVVYKDVSF